MVIKSNAEILFYGAREVGVSISTDAVGEGERFQEILFFCCFSADQLAKVGKKYANVATLIALLLMNLRANLVELAKHETVDTPRLSFLKEAWSKKRIVAKLTCTSHNVEFSSRQKGLGFFSWNRACRAANAVLFLTRYLAKQRISDSAYVTALAQAASMVGSSYIRGDLSTTSRHTEARLIAVKAAGTASA
jgi:hypothetical protein